MGSFDGNSKKLAEKRDDVARVDPGRFDRALDFYLENEGGDVDHESDPGGVTSRGISAEYNPELEDVTRLSDAEVREHYRKKYWRRVFGRLKSDDVAIKIFDISTNAGFDDASMVLQRAINDCGGEVMVDGVMGSRTVAGANSVDQLRLLRAVCQRQWLMYQEKMEQAPEKIAFYNGWMRRAKRVPA